MKHDQHKSPDHASIQETARDMLPPYSEIVRANTGFALAWAHIRRTPTHPLHTVRGELAAAAESAVEVRLGDSGGPLAVALELAHQHRIATEGIRRAVLVDLLGFTADEATDYIDAVEAGDREPLPEDPWQTDLRVAPEALMVGRISLLMQELRAFREGAPTQPAPRVQ